MPMKRLAMRQIHRLMGLHFGAGLGARAIGRELGISHSTVREYLARIAAANFTWPLSPDITETALEQHSDVRSRCPTSPDQWQSDRC
jgi:hypothetical protein